MRIRFHLTDNAKDVLGEVVIMCVLGLALLASYSCGPESPVHETTADEESTPPYTYETVSRTTIVPVTERADVAPVEVASEPVVVTYEIAETAYREGRFPDAVALFEGYVANQSENPWGHYMLGLSARMAGDVETSVSAFERALELDPRHIKSHLNLSRVLIGAGRLEEAEVQIERALEIDDESGDAFRLLGRVASEQGDADRAIESFEHALLINEWDTWSMNNLGVLFITEGRYDYALQPLARAVELRGDVAVFQNNLGMALERIGYFVEATEAYRAAVALDPGHTRASSNFQRIDGRTNRTDLPPVHLDQVAADFAAEIVSWRLRLADVPTVDALDVEAAADTTPPMISIPSSGEIKPDTVLVPRT